MKLEKLYEEIKQYEIPNRDEKFASKGDLYVQANKQFFKHFLDRISYKFLDKYIIIYSPKLKKTFKIPDSNLKNIELDQQVLPQSMTYPTYLFGYEPILVNDFDNEYIWNDKELFFYLEKIR